MQNHTQHDNATSNVLAWSSNGANVEPAVDEDTGADADEPPDPKRGAGRFRKAVVQAGLSHHESLLTKALQSHSEDETFDYAASLMGTKRRRSLTSNGSFASTGGMTSDTGITTPPRTNPSSPHLSDVGFASLAVKLEQQVERLDGTAATMNQPKASAAPATEKKRCISFACGGRPVQKDAPAVVPPQNLNSEAAKSKVPVRPCIKFAACPTRPARPHTPPRDGMDTQKATTRGSAVAQRSVSPAMIRKMRSSSVGQTRGGRSATPRRSAQSPVTRRPKIYLTAESQDLQCESSRFHEFGSDEPQEHDWIRQDKFDTRHRLTIDDTLKKELAIRRLGKEAEEEAEQEDEDDDDEAGEAANGDDVDEDAEEEEEEEVDEDNNSGYGSDVSDGYNSDNEVGFASSEDEDDDLVLWSTHRPAHRRLSGATPVCRRPSFGEHSDSSAYSLKTARHSKSRVRATTSHNRPRTPELPDSTDFVCGTLDEDRPVEEAYKSRMAARKRKKLHLIPQDIDPSFPTSGPEDEGGEELFKPAQHDSDEHVWVHGEIEDIHHDQERADRRKKKGGESPRRYHSPPPKPRGRSPRRLFDRHTPPRRLRSPPASHMMASPPASPVQLGEGIAFKSLASRPGLTHTKSLPRAPAMFPNMKVQRRSTMTKHRHVRGAIDIVKGLEQKRQRRREKFLQKYCNRARKGQVAEKRPLPGQGAERMKELGLLIGGKLGQGNYVLSF